MAARGPDRATFAQRVVAWQRAHGRHELPWQQTQDAYRIWVSEIMLQQTQVATVIPYYARFMTRFPSVGALAAAPVDEVMAHWSGLGYYSRARNLHRCAIAVMDTHQGVFPTDAATLAELPGIGRSTAAAIAAFSSGARAAILDGNVKRVLARVYGIEGWPSERRVEQAMWTLAEALLPAPDSESIADYTQGLMDLGATLCVRSRPLCQRCPLMSDCVAFREKRQAELPTRRTKKPLPTRQTSMLVLRRGEAVLLYRRPPTGIWGGLWSLPEAADASVLAERARTWGVSDALQPLAEIAHTFTHFRLEISALEGHVAESQPALPGQGGGDAGCAEDEFAWVALGRLNEVGVPAPVRKLLDSMSGSLL
ncbi:MAG: A/G-specific adenine glycosylase [Janthinobacterium lividum]